MNAPRVVLANKEKLCCGHVKSSSLSFCAYKMVLNWFIKNQHSFTFKSILMTAQKFYTQTWITLKDKS